MKPKHEHMCSEVYDHYEEDLSSPRAMVLFLVTMILYLHIPIVVLLIIDRPWSVFAYAAGFGFWLSRWVIIRRRDRMKRGAL